MGAHGTSGARQHGMSTTIFGIGIAGDRSALDLRGSLRAQMAGSPLCDEVRAKVECA
jgi:hypothetical protein